MSLKAIVCVGPCASGKTTYANKMVEEGWCDVNRDWIRFNVVCPGTNWSNYKFTNKREQEVTETQMLMISEAFFRDQNVIVSDTNLNSKTRNRVIKALEEIGYDVEIKEFDVSYEEAVKRDRLRANGVGEDVIYSMYNHWLEYKGSRTYTRDKSKPKAVIFDIDGTLATNDGARGWYDWANVGKDKPRQLIVDIAKGLSSQDYVILCVSGRDVVCYDETREWLNEHEVPFFYLYMREEGDMRCDRIVKEEIFFDLIADYWDVVGVLDDRPKVVDMWHQIGIENVLAVADQHNKF